MEIILTDELQKLNAFLDSDDGDWDAHDVFPKVYMLHDYAVDGDRKVGTIECGSFSFTDTPKALYRVLFLAKPKRIDFSSMYKSNSLFALTSPDGHFVADFQTYKYELAAYLSAAPEHVEGRESGLICGVPGSDNGIRAKSPELKLWADTLKKCLDRTWMVYGGNDFEV